MADVQSQGSMIQMDLSSNCSHLYPCKMPAKQDLVILVVFFIPLRL